MIIDGKQIAEHILLSIKEKVSALPQKPTLAVILVWENPASLSYIKQKMKSAEICGIHFRFIRLPESVSEKVLLEQISACNTDKEVTGFIVQLPLPTHLSAKTVIEAIDPKKDVDGFSPHNIGKLFLGQDTLAPCTPKGVMKLLESIGKNLVWKEVTVIGKSNIVGKPMALMLMNAGATVTVCAKETKDISIHTKKADIIIMATWSPHLLKREMVKSGATIIDIGFTKKDGVIYGDADFENLVDITDITPVPGGVGPMTVAMLMENTYTAQKP